KEPGNDWEKEFGIEVEKELEKEIEKAVEKELEAEIEMDFAKEVETEAEKEPKMELEKELEKEIEKVVEKELEMEIEREVQVGLEKEVKTEVQKELKMEPCNKYEKEFRIEVEEELVKEVEKEFEMELEKEDEKEIEKVFKGKLEMVLGKDVEMGLEKEPGNDCEKEFGIEVEKEPEKEIEKAVEKELETEIKMYPAKEIETVAEKELQIKPDKDCEKEFEKEFERELEKDVEIEDERKMLIDVKKDLHREVDQNAFKIPCYEGQLKDSLVLDASFGKKKKRNKNQKLADFDPSDTSSTQVKNDDKISDAIFNKLEPVVLGNKVNNLVKEEFQTEMKDRLNEEKKRDELYSEKRKEDVKIEDVKKHKNEHEEVEHKIFEKTNFDDLTESSTALNSKLSKKKKKKKNRKSLDITMIKNTHIQEDDEKDKFNAASKIFKPSVIESTYDLDPLKELSNEDKIGKHVDKEDEKGLGKERKNNVEEVNKFKYPKKNENEINLEIRENYFKDDDSKTFVTQTTDPPSKKKMVEIQKKLDSVLLDSSSSRAFNENDHVSDKSKSITAKLINKADDKDKPFDIIKEKQKMPEAIIKTENETEDPKENEKEVELKVSDTCQDKVEDSLIPVTSLGKKKKKKKNQKRPNPSLTDLSSILVNNDDKVPDDMSNTADCITLQTKVDTVIKVEQSDEIIDRLKDEKKNEEDQKRLEAEIKTENKIEDQNENEKGVKSKVSETSQDKQFEDSSIPITISTKKKKKKKNQKRPDSGLTEASQVLDEKGKNDAIDKIFESHRPDLNHDTSNVKLRVEESKIRSCDEDKMEDNAQSLIKFDENGNVKDCEKEDEREDQEVDARGDLGEVYLTNFNKEESWKECTGEHEKLGEENLQQMVLEKSCHDNQLKSSTTLVTNLDRKKKKDKNQKKSTESVINESSIRINNEVDTHKPISGIDETSTPVIKVNEELKNKFLSEKDIIANVKGEKIYHQKSNEINVGSKILEIPLEDSLLKYSPASVITSGKKKKKMHQKRSDSNLTDISSIQVITDNKIHDATFGISDSLMLESKQKVEANDKNLDEVIGSQSSVEKNEIVDKKDPEVLEKPHQSFQFENLDKEEKRNKDQKILDGSMIDLLSIKVTTEEKLHKNLPEIYHPMTFETKIYEEAKQEFLNEEVKEVVKDNRAKSKELHKIEDSLKFVELCETKLDDKGEEEIQLMVSERAQKDDQNEILNTLKPTSSAMKNFEVYNCKALDTVVIETESDQKINENKICDDQFKGMHSSIPITVYHEKIPEKLWSGKESGELEYVSFEISQQDVQPESYLIPSNALGETEIDEVSVDTTILSAVNKNEKYDGLSDVPTPFVPEVISNLDTKQGNLNDKEDTESSLDKKRKKGGNEVQQELQKKDVLIASHESNQVERLSILVTDSSKPEIFDRFDPIVSDTQLIHSSDENKKHDFLVLSIESSTSLPIHEGDVVEKSFNDKVASELFTNNENKYIQSNTNPDSSLDVLSRIPAKPKNDSSLFLADFFEIDKIENVSTPASISKTDPGTEKELSENPSNVFKSREVIEKTVSTSSQGNHSTDNPKSIKTSEKENKNRKYFSAPTQNNLVKIEEDESYIGKNSLFSKSNNSEEVESKTCQKTPGLAEDSRKDPLKSYSESSTSMFGIVTQDPDKNNVQSNLCNLNTPLKSKIRAFAELPISSSSKFFDSGSSSIKSILSKNDHLDASSSNNNKSLLSTENFDESTTQLNIKSFSDPLVDNYHSPLRSSRSSHFGFSKLPIVVEEKNLENVEQNDRLLHQIEANNDNSITSKKDAYKGNIKSPSISTYEIPHHSEKFLLRNFRSFQMIPQEKPMDIRRSSSYSGNLSNKGLVQKRIEKFESPEEINNPNKLGKEIVETPPPQKSTRKINAGLNFHEPRVRKPSKVEQGIITAVVDVAIKGSPAILDLDIEQRTSDLKNLNSSSMVNNLPSQESRILDHENSPHSLRRSKPQTSGDLRSLSQHKEKLGPDKPNPPQDKQITSRQAPQPNEGRIRVKDMADVLDGVGEGHMISPRSPTRPHSLRRRQSMKVMDLESKVENLVEQNRILAEEKQNIEQQIKSSVQISLAKKDAELEALTRTLNFLQEEVSKLTEVNEGLNCAASAITQQYSDRNTILESERAKLSQELEQIRKEYKRLTLNFQNELHSKISVKDRKIAELRTELDVAKQKIREAQKQILLSKGCDLEYLSLKYEDYFENACQKLCQHVQQWVLRFSKYSDMKSCRLTGEIGDDKIVERLDNAILDGSDVDTYLSDRIKRRDVFMSIVMTMIWEYIFTRYLFGMGRDQRQKLKSLEKTLSEVGPASAVHSWRAITLTLLSKRTVFIQQKEQDTQAVVDVVINTLSEILPPPSNFERQIQEQLSRVMNEAVDLSIDMRCQRAEYMMLPPLQPEYDTNGEVLSKVLFNAAVMNERSGDTVSNKELEAQKAIVRIVLFPLVVKRGDDSGQTKQETIICPAQVLIAKPKSLVHRDDEVRSKISMKSNSHTMKSEYSSLGLPS
ncbi:hypothetical protein EPUL_004878, partial [Erysiphe pulchra]